MENESKIKKFFKLGTFYNLKFERGSFFKLVLLFVLLGLVTALILMVISKYYNYTYPVFQFD